MRLIDADAVLNFERFDLEVTGEEHTANDILMMIQTAPTIGPVHAAGGCYCRECCFGHEPKSEFMRDGYVYCEQQAEYKELEAFCSDGQQRRRDLSLDEKVDGWDVDIQYHPLDAPAPAARRGGPS